ncbi:MAG: class I SAM-dependent methyltransferase [Chloroflexi bacterium]|nr:class I SAM-dependent methyltransferase [Chloroflexota bacterium]
MTLKLYSDLAGWFHLLTAPSDYAEDAELCRKAIVDASEEPPRTVLELGSGGGNNASHMKAHFALTLTDLSPQMLAISKELNPECEHIEGDMRTLRLGRAFDAVFIHDAVSYLTTAADLRAAIETAFAHCKPGGVTLFAPDHVRESFRARTSHGGHDGEGRSLRYLEWSYDPDPSDTTYVTEMVYLLREGDGPPRVEYERHTMGLFVRNVWLSLLREAGFHPTVVPFEHSGIEPGSQSLFIATRPAT